MVAFENINLWHERDISHSSAERVILPDSTIALNYMLNKFIQVIEGLNVYPKNMMVNLIKTKGLIFSQRVLLMFMEAGLPRTKAYDIVQRAAMRTWKEGIDFKSSLLEEPEVPKYLSEKKIDEAFDLNYYLRQVSKIFNRVGL